MKNEEFFANWSECEVVECNDINFAEFAEYDDLLPELGQANFIGDGADGSCFTFFHGKNKRVIKFGVNTYWRNGRDEDDGYPSNVESTDELIHRLHLLLASQEICLPKVYQATALNSRLYIIVMEYLPFGGNLRDDNVSLHEDGEVRVSDMWLEQSPKLKLWLDSYKRLNRQGLKHRDLHNGNVRRDINNYIKFIDLESFCFFWPKDLRKVA